MSSTDWREEFARQVRRRASRRRRRKEEGREETGRNSQTGQTGRAVSREDQLISSSLVTYYLVRIDCNTPGTAGGPGGRDRTLAIKSRKTDDKNTFFS